MAYRAVAASSSAASTESLTSRVQFSQTRLLPSRSYVCSPLPSCKLRLASSRHHRPRYRPRPRPPYVTFQAAQSEAKVVDDQEDKDASTSDYESSDDDSITPKEEPSMPTVESLLKQYKDALSNNDEAATVELDAMFQQLERGRVDYTKQAATLNEEVSSLKDRLLRLNADFDNFRKRSERDRISISTNVKGDVVNSLLPMVDNFERAKTQIKIETEGEQRIDSSYQGIYKQFVDIMKGLGVSAVETIGKEFDPNVHEAVMREESTEYAENLIIEEFRRGFMLGDKLLRPSMVKVSSGPPASAAADPGDGVVIHESMEEAAEEDTTQTYFKHSTDWIGIVDTDLGRICKLPIAFKE